MQGRTLARSLSERFGFHRENVNTSLVIGLSLVWLALVVAPVLDSITRPGQFTLQGLTILMTPLLVILLSKLALRDSAHLTWKTSAIWLLVAYSPLLLVLTRPQPNGGVPFSIGDSWYQLGALASALAVVCISRIAARDVLLSIAVVSIPLAVFLSLSAIFTINASPSWREWLLEGRSPLSYQGSFLIVTGLIIYALGKISSTRSWILISLLLVGATFSQIRTVWVSVVIVSFWFIWTYFRDRDRIPTYAIPLVLVAPFAVVMMQPGALRLLGRLPQEAPSFPESYGDNVVDVGGASSVGWLEQLLQTDHFASIAWRLELWQRVTHEFQGTARYQELPILEVVSTHSTYLSLWLAGGWLAILAVAAFLIWLTCRSGRFVGISALGFLILAANSFVWNSPPTLWIATAALAMGASPRQSLNPKTQA